MAEKQLKTKDMIIAVICTLLTILCIVFYFLPALGVEHSANLGLADSKVESYSAWQITQALFTKSKYMNSDIIGLMYIKDVFGMAVAISGILLPLGIICGIVTTVFAYLSWFKGEQFKKYCFLFSLCGMVFTTITLISTWFIAIQLRNGEVYIEYFSANIKGTIAYGSFVSLILSFVIAIVACAYNYFLDNFDDEDDEDEDEEDEDDEDDEEEIVESKKKVKKVVEEVKEEPKKTTTKTTATKKPTTTSTTATSTTKNTTTKTA